MPSASTKISIGLAVSAVVLLTCTAGVGAIARPIVAKFPDTVPEAEAKPRYTAAGELIVPADYRDWIFLSSGVNMNYGDEPLNTGAPNIDNVFVDPASWKLFKASVRWPDGTIFVKEGRAGSRLGSINKSGIFQTERRLYLEIHVRDSKRFKGGWGFFDDAVQPGRLNPAGASCYACHEKNGAVDTTFTQFYPTAKPIAVLASTFDAEK
jgi:hypothetical protein